MSNDQEIRVDMNEVPPSILSGENQEKLERLKKLLKLKVDTQDDKEPDSTSQEFLELHDSDEELDEVEINKLINREIIAYQDKDGNTLLHLAADDSQVAPVKYLLEKAKGLDVEIVNIVNKTGKIPLHLVLDGGSGCHCTRCTAKNVKCTELLVEFGSDLDKQDDLGDTSFGNAALAIMPECATVLWNEPVDLTIKNQQGTEVGVLVAKHLSKEVYKWMDAGIEPCKVSVDYLHLNFGLLLKSKSSTTMDTSQLLNEKETSFLLQITKAGKKARDDLLLHPLIQAYLHLKWQAVDILFTVLRCAYLGLVLLYTCFIFSIFLYKCPSAFEEIPESETRYLPIFKANKTNNGMEIKNTHKTHQLLLQNASVVFEKLGDDSTVEKCEKSTWIYVLAAVLFFFVVCMVLNEMFELWYQKMNYFYIRLNYAWWIMIIAVSVNLLPVFMDNIDNWQYPIASFGVFLSWAMFFTQLARDPRIGVYVEMFGRVLTQFVVFAMTYTVLFIGFACGFIVLFPTNGMFEKEYNLLSIVKLILMMNGETDYETLFDEELNPLIDGEDPSYLIGAHIMFIGFILVVTIVLMNLLLGLAVSDVQELKAAAEVSKAQRLIEQIDLVETVFKSNWVPRFLTTWYKSGCSVQRQCALYSDVVGDRDSKKQQCKFCSGIGGDVGSNTDEIGTNCFRFSPYTANKPGGLPAEYNDGFMSFAIEGKCAKAKEDDEQIEPTMLELNKKIDDLTQLMKTFMDSSKK